MYYKSTTSKFDVASASYEHMLNIFRRQLDSQTLGEDELQWPNFQLYSINGLRRSDSMSSSDATLVP